MLTSQYGIALSATVTPTEAYTSVRGPPVRPPCVSLRGDLQTIAGIADATHV